MKSTGWCSSIIPLYRFVIVFQDGNHTEKILLVMTLFFFFSAREEGISKLGAMEESYKLNEPVTSYYKKVVL
jgi:hypothetical protein